DGPIIQQRQVLARLAGKQNVIAMGDFNFEPTTEQYMLTLQSLADAWVLAGSPPTAGFDPQERIDYVFVSPQLSVQSARYVISPASDHPALVAEIVTGIP
ncbi:MAG: endonuclease/exonuclease/phosphatase family protein, partial [Anaerolineales bacterium]